jgi:hypothetical protein
MALIVMVYMAMASLANSKLGKAILALFPKNKDRVFGCNAEKMGGIFFGTYLDKNAFRRPSSIAI